MNKKYNKETNDSAFTHAKAVPTMQSHLQQQTTTKPSPTRTGQVKGSHNNINPIKEKPTYFR